MAKAFYNLLAIVGVGDMRISMFFIKISLFCCKLCLLATIYAANQALWHWL